MRTLHEGELRITLPETASGRSFDVPAHGLSHCMKAVDWIIELPDRIYFIELPAGLHPNWRRAIAQDCLVFNVEKWNRALRVKALLRPESAVTCGVLS